MSLTKEQQFKCYAINGIYALSSFLIGLLLLVINDLSLTFSLLFMFIFTFMGILIGLMHSDLYIRKCKIEKK